MNRVIGSAIGIAAVMAAMTCCRCRAQGAAQPDMELAGMQGIYLRAPVQRFYAAEPDSGATLTTDDLTLANISADKRVYPRLDALRRTIQADPALNAFLADGTIGPVLRQALKEASLYACLPLQGQAGLNPFNEAALPALFRGKRGANGRPRPTPAAGPAGVIRTPGGGRAVLIQDFSVLAAVAPDGLRANLYVLGELPQVQASDLPVDFTVEGKQYGADTAGEPERASSETVIDRTELPVGTDSQRYFCFVYPLSTPQAGSQNDLLVSFWPAKNIAITHGIALAQPGSAHAAAGPSSWTLIPVTRLQRYQPLRPIRYLTLANAPLGDPLAPTMLQVRRQIALALRQRRALASTKQKPAGQ